MKLLSRVLGPSGSGPSTDPDTAKHLQRLSDGLTTLAARVDAQAEEVLGLEERSRQLTLAVSEGIDRVNRAEGRIRATVARAQRELRERGVESPGVEAEARSLRDADGGGGEDGGLQRVHASVADDPDPLQLDWLDSVPGEWTAEEIRALKG